MWNVLFVILVTVFMVAFLGWEIYDCGYDRGWNDRDEGKPPGPEGLF